jgi:hypothetical protein
MGSEQDGDGFSLEDVAGESGRADAPGSGLNERCDGDLTGAQTRTYAPPHPTTAANTSPTPAYAQQEGGDPEAGSRQRQKGGDRAPRRAKGGGGASALEGELAAAAAAAAAGRDAEVPDWVRQLQAEGFGVQGGRGGEVFLQRGSAAAGPRPEKRQPSSQQQQQQQQQQRAQASASSAAPAAPVDPRVFAVGVEFAPDRWLGVLAPRAARRRQPAAQQTFEEDDGFGGDGEGAGGPDGQVVGQEDAGPSGGDAVWWLGDDAAGAAAVQHAARASSGAAADAAGSSGGAAAAPSATGGDWQQRVAGAAQVCGLLAKADSPEQLLRAVEAAFPAWAMNNCRLVHQATGLPVAAPGPAEAAQVLKAVALAARRRRMKPAQMLELVSRCVVNQRGRSVGLLTLCPIESYSICDHVISSSQTTTHGAASCSSLLQGRDRRVRGLAECLRVTPPRVDSAIKGAAAVGRRMWAAAKDYWTPSAAADVEAAAAAVVGRTPAAAEAPPAGVNGVAPSDHAQQQQQQQQQPQQQLAGLVARVKAGGVQLTRGQVEAARKLLELREAERRRREAFVAALWGLSVIGGPWLFEEEVEALMQVGRGAGLDNDQNLDSRAYWWVCVAALLASEICINRPETHPGRRPVPLVVAPLRPRGVGRALGPGQRAPLDPAAAAARGRRRAGGRADGAAAAPGGRRAVGVCDAGAFAGGAACGARAGLDGGAGRQPALPAGRPAGGRCVVAGRDALR